MGKRSSNSASSGLNGKADGTSQSRSSGNSSRPKRDPAAASASDATPRRQRRLSGSAGGSIEKKASSKAKVDKGKATQTSSSKKKKGKRRKGKDKKPSLSPPTYRWVDEGEVEASTGAVVHSKVEVVVRGRKSLIQPGDTVLLFSGDDDDAKALGIAREVDNSLSSSEGEEDSDDDDASDEENDESARTDGGGDDPLPGPDPFVARVEKLWEENEPASTGGRRGNSGNKDDYDLERRSRMKIRARWFFKKADIESLGGTFVGASRERLLATMTDQDLILGDQTDDNEVPTILGKCRVFRALPLSREHPKNLGDFVSRYTVTIHPPANPRNGARGTVVFKPYQGDLEEFGPTPTASVSGDESSRPKKRQKTNGNTSSSVPGVQSLAKDGTNSNIVSTSVGGVGQGGGNVSLSENDGLEVGGGGGGSGGPNSNNFNNSSSDDDMGLSGDDVSSFSSQKRKVTETEGSTTEGTIKIGPDHQAVVPTKPVGGRGGKKRKSPVVWKPGSIPEEDLNSYLSKASETLMSYAEANGIDTVSPYASLKLKNDSSSSQASPNSNDKGCRQVTRECNVDELLRTLHESNYDTKKALVSVSKYPRRHLTIWTKHEKELFNAGFRRYCGSLRMIAKGVATGNKTFKDVVDYHYRFKIPDQFRRFQEKKRDQARRMMECVENRGFADALARGGGGSEEGPGGAKGGSAGAGSGMGVLGTRRARNWAKTGGGASDTIGATEQRRVSAKDFLTTVRDTIGLDNYVKLAKLLKSYHSRDTSIPSLKDKATALLEDNPDLLERFFEFLPKKFRG